MDKPRDTNRAVRAAFSKMKPKEEIDAWGMARHAQVEPLTAESVLNQLVKEGIARRDGNWYGLNLQRPSERCGECDNCKELDRIKGRVLACCNPPFSHSHQPGNPHADYGVVEYWNRELVMLPCTGKEGT